MLLSAILLLSGLCAAAPATEAAEKFNGPSDPKRFKFFSTPTQGGICDGDTGPDGYTLWYQDLIRARVGYLNTTDGRFREKQIPYSKGSPVGPPFVGNVSALQCVVRTGKDGYIYAGAGTRNEIVRINPNTFELQIFSPKNQNPVGNLQNFNDAWAADQGLFFSQTTGNVVTLFDYKTHIFKNFECPTRQSGPLGMRTDKHNNLWFTNFQGQFISKLDNRTQKITEYHDCCPLPQSSFPEVLRASTENQKFLWANAFGGGGFIRINVEDPDNPKFHTFTNPRGAGTFPFENDNDYCGRVWYTSPTFAQLNYYNPKTKHWTTVEVPNKGVPGGNFEVIMHRSPGHYMWFCEGTEGRLGRYTLDADCVGESS